jgi:hypothetical protein
MLGDEQDDPATQLANRMSECLEVAHALTSAALWARYSEAVPIGERKKKMLEVLGDFTGSAPLVELPYVHGPKQMLRDTIAIAKELEPLVAAWDEGTEPTAAMTATATRFLECMRSAPPGETP